MSNHQMKSRENRKKHYSRVLSLDTEAERIAKIRVSDDVIVHLQRNTKVFWNVSVFFNKIWVKNGV